MLNGALFALTILQAAAIQAAPPGAVQGRTLTDDRGELVAVASATVSARSVVPTSAGAETRATMRYGTTDASGRFRFDGLADGTWLLRAEHPGYAPVDVEVVLSGGRSVTVDLILEVSPVDLDPVLVRGDPELPDTGVDTGISADLQGEEAAAVTLQAMEVGSGMAASGMAGLFQAVPGNDPADPTDALFMRGSALDLKVVLLDGAPLYTPFHVSGLIPSFDPVLLESARLYNGGAPAEFDGGLSHVLDLRTRPARGDGMHARGSADLMSARLGAETSLGSRAGLSLGGRVLHAAAERVLDRTGFPYGYADGMARFDVTPAEGHSLSVTGFRNEESVRLDFRGEITADELQASRAAGVIPSRSSWGNSALTAGYHAELDRTSVQARAALSRYGAELPVQGETPLFASGTTDRTRLVLAVGRRGSDERNTRWAAGATLDAVDVRYRAARLTDSTGAVGTEVESTATGSVVAGYLEGSTQLRDRLRVSGGARGAVYEGSGMRIGPRIALTWLLTDDAAFSIKAGRSHQLTTNSDAAVETALGLDQAAETAAGPGALVSVASSTHLVVGVDQLLSPTTRLGIEGWARRYEGIGLAGMQSLNGSGFDLRLARGGESIDGWLGYSLTWFWSDDVASDSPFSGRHLLSAGLLGDIGGGGRFNVQMAFGDGLPFTAIRVSDATAVPEGDLDPGRDPEPDLDVVAEQARGGPALTGGPQGDFLRLDGELSWRVATSMGGRSVEVRPYVRVLNALNRRDAMFYYFEPWRDVSPRPLAELSIVPVVGLSWRF